MSGTENRRRRGSFPLPALLLASLGTVSGVLLVSTWRPAVFQPVFGALPPVVAALLICLAGVAALFLLGRHWAFRIYAPEASRKGILVAAACASPFMVSVTLADVLLGFPSGINVPPPTALLFYPLMGYLAQLALHVVPLAGSLLICRIVLRSWTVRRQIGLSIVLAATLEAAFQALSSVSDGGQPLLVAFVAAQLFLFGIVELNVFRRYDFVSMYVFRLTYYGYWHIFWGQLRLEWLF